MAFALPFRFNSTTKPDGDFMMKLQQDFDAFNFLSNAGWSIDGNGNMHLNMSNLINAANDAAAAAAGATVGQVYRNGSVLMVRVV